MFKLGTKTGLSPQEVIKQAVEYFGTEGQGLEIVESSPNAVCFEGGGGRVEIVACTEKKGAFVNLVSLEWDYQVKKFASSIR